MGDVLGVAAGVLCAIAFGSMVFFAAVVAPLVFTQLPEDVAGSFIRKVFPRYYLALGLATGAAALAALPGTPSDAAALALICAGFVMARQGLMPRINTLRDRELAGDADAGARFQRAHRNSVLLNVVQMGMLLVVLVRAVS